MKKLYYILYIFLLFAFIGCTEDFLDRKDLYDRLDENFYSNTEQIEQALTAAYSKLANDYGNQDFNLVASIKSDDRFGGGGTTDLIPHDADLFTNSAEDTWLEMWLADYEGIFRCNMIICMPRGTGGQPVAVSLNGWRRILSRLRGETSY